MKALANGNFLFQEGEPLPYLCPKCKTPTEYREGVQHIECADCGFLGSVEEFSGFNWRLRNGEWIPVPKEKRQ